MKKIFLLVSLCIGFTAPQVFADAAEEIKLAREIAQKQKQLIILENLDLTEAEEQAFLPVYMEYQKARRFNNEALGRLIIDFAENYDVMTNAKALSLLDDVLTVKEGRMTIKRGYVDKFKAVLPGKKVARYYQIESKLEALAEVKLAEVIPLLQ